MYSPQLQLSRVKVGQSALLEELNKTIVASPYEARFANGVEEAIIVGISPLGWYLVSPVGGGPLRWAKSVAEANNKPWGFRTEEAYSYFDRVLIWVDDEGDEVVILGVIPEESLPEEELTSFHAQATGTSYKQVDVLNELDPKDDKPIWARGSKAIDWLPGIDRSLLTPFGGGWHVDLFWSYFRALEGVGISFFTLQGLAQLAGVQLQFQSAFHEDSYLVNQELGIREYGVTPYKQESLGFRRDQKVSLKTNTDLLSKRNYNAVNDVDWDTLPLYRYQQLSGFSGELRALGVPPQQAKLGQEDYPDNLFLEHISADGNYYLSSRTGVFLHKSAYIPSWVRQKHFHDKDVQIPTSELWESIQGWDQDYAGVLALDDLLARRVYEAATPLDKTIYKVKPPSQSPRYKTPNYSELKGNEILSLQPQSLPLYDLRSSTTQNYDLPAGVYILPDGDVVIRGGGGCELTLSRGNLFIHAPGNVVVSSGRKVGLLAGDDLVGVAGKSLEMFALENDLRLLANKNFEITSALSGRGRLLLENKAKKQETWKHEKTGEDIDSEGIFLKTDSRVCVYGDKVALDAQEIVHQSFTHRLLTTNLYREYYQAIDSVGLDGLFYLSENVLLFNGRAVLIKGVDIPDGGLNVKDYVAILDGHIASSTGGEVGKLAPRSRFAMSRAFRQEIDDANRLESGYDREIKEEYRKAWTEDQKPLNGQFKEELMFAPRNAEQNDEDRYKQPKPYWVKLAQSSGQPAETVDIPQIPYHDGRAYFPWPYMGYYVDATWKLAMADGIQDFSDTYRQLQLSTFLESWELYRV